MKTKGTINLNAQSMKMIIEEAFLIKPKKSLEAQKKKKKKTTSNWMIVVSEIQV